MGLILRDVILDLVSVKELSSNPPSKADWNVNSIVRKEITGRLLFTNFSYVFFSFLCQILDKSYVRKKSMEETRWSCGIHSCEEEGVKAGDSFTLSLPLLFSVVSQPMT